MIESIRRLLIAAIMLQFISLLLGSSRSEASSISISERTKDWIWPSDGVISDLFNSRNGHHKGIDIAGELDSPIYVVDDGRVVKSYLSKSYGNVIFVKHHNGMETVYAHLNKRKVKENETVEKGDIIGMMGNTGESSGVHLHFELHNKKWTITKKNAVNPILALGNVEVGQSVHATHQKKDKYAAYQKQRENDVVQATKEIKRMEAYHNPKKATQTKNSFIDFILDENTYSLLFPIVVKFL
ncbi:M23 family metallopeptidase [Niallia sp. 01092]|uniref:M23 family metallopeptidase n=1 Tax=unclassified Niallia TaxID=2837522 RepID=UPI003FD62D4F